MSQQLTPIDGDQHRAEASRSEPLPKFVVRRFGTKRFRLRLAGRCICVAPDGSRAAVAVADRSSIDPNVVHIFDATSGDPVVTLSRHAFPVHGLAYAPDGARLASCGTDGMIRLWNPRNGELVSEIRGSRTGVKAVAFSPDGKRLYATTFSSLVRIFGVASGNEESRFKADLPTVSNLLAVSLDGSTFATATSYAVSLWRLPGPDRIGRLRTDELTICALAFSPDGKTLASAEDETIRLLAVEGARERHALEPGMGSVNALAYSPNGRFLAAGGRNGTVALWDAVSLQLRRRLTGHTDGVNAIAFSPDSVRLFSTGEDRTLRVWDVESGRCLLPYGGHVHAVQGIAFVDDDTRLLSASLDGTVRVWDVGTGKEIERIDAHRRGIVRFAVDAAEGRFITAERVDDAEEPTGLTVSSLRDGKELFKVKGQTGAVRGIAVLHGRNQFVTGARRDGVRLWNAASGTLLKTALWREEPIESVAAAPDGNVVAVGYYDGVVQFVNSASLAVQREFQAHDSYGYASASALAFSPDGRMLASASNNDETARLWEVATLQPLATLEGHEGWVTSVCFSADGRLLATCGFDRTVRIWEAAAHKLLCTLEGHDGHVNCLAFSHDGRLLASGAGDTTILLWDVDAALRSGKTIEETGQ